MTYEQALALLKKSISDMTQEEKRLLSQAMKIITNKFSRPST